MARHRNSKRVGFLKDYRLDEVYLQKPDLASGRPGILEGTAEDGETVLVKEWPRKPKQPDADLTEIWLHELRQLHRLYGYPGAASLVTPLKTTGFDDRGFYLVLDPGSRRPLGAILQSASNSNWLKQPRLFRNRWRIWANLKRTAQAIEMLHVQGMLHSNLDTWSILTAASEEPDFQLTGFEWSMRIASVDDVTDKRSTLRPRFARYDSFREDWASFARLAADLVGAPRDKLAQFGIAPSAVAEHLTSGEVRALRSFLSVEQLTRLDGEVVVRWIDEILSDLASEAAGKEVQHHLVARLGPNVRLAEEIQNASGGQIETDDLDAQLEFIRNDLSDAPILMAIKDSAAIDFRLALRGHHLIYRLGEYRHSQFQDAASWEFAQTERIESKPPVQANLVGQQTLDPNSIRLLSVKEAAASFPRLRGRLAGWDELRKKFQTTDVQQTPELKFKRALSLTQMLEMAFAAADSFPIRILSGPRTMLPDGNVQMRVSVRHDADRERLSKSLGLRSPAARLEQLVSTDDYSEEAVWMLTDIGLMGERGQADTEWRFQEVRKTGSGLEFIFNGPGPVPDADEVFLLPSGSVGQNTQFRRRLKSLKALGEHVELLRMLVNPRRRLFDSHDNLTHDKAFEKLDAPKQAALTEAVSTMPIYMVQGPPGVGKTRLVRELVRRKFEEEPTTRVLLSAQSNAAIDHLMGELQKTFDEETTKKPLVVRSRSKDRPEGRSAFEIGKQADAMLASLASSAILDEASPELREKIQAMIPGAAERPRPRFASRAQSPEYARRAFEGLILRAANIVFATTNSAEIERLIDERGQFDWSIVEEAGKATGGDLLSPMLLSHRRMMIGDHKQLPPYRSEEMKKLLTSTDEVRKVIAIAGDVIGRSLRDADMEELLDEIATEEATLDNLCSDAVNVMLLFETLVEKEFLRQAGARPGRPIARRLSTQHRMHPAIARVVSHCFYGDALTTDEDRRIAFESEKNPPVRSSDPDRLPEGPIVVVNMPYLQSTVGLKTGEEAPAWRNRAEVEAVLSAIEHLEANGASDQKPTLAVLSPYSRQVNLLEREIEDAQSHRLSNLANFVPAAKSGTFCTTVDSFQGSEADVVIVSLVRNNQHTTPAKALGFLRDSRRMNVLLSRAKWKLVLVGSLDFIEAITAAMSNEDKQEYDFLPKLLNSIKKGEKTHEIAVISPAKLERSI